MAKSVKRQGKAVEMHAFEKWDSSSSSSSSRRVILSSSTALIFLLLPFPHAPSCAFKILRCLSRRGTVLSLIVSTSSVLIRSITSAPPRTNALSAKHVWSSSVMVPAHCCCAQSAGMCTEPLLRMPTSQKRNSPASTSTFCAIMLRAPELCAQSAVWCFVPWHFAPSMIVDEGIDAA